MHKIYLVLRNNQQSGPYSLEELLQLPLNPHDLVWVDGQSAGWRYPGEIEALKPHIPNTSQPLPLNNIVEEENKQDVTAKPEQGPGKLATPRHIYVSLPAGKASPTTTEPDTDPIEKKASELYQRVQAYNQTHEASAKDEKDPHPQPRTVEQMRQDYEAWMTRQKKKKKQAHILKQAMAVVMVFLILTTGFVLAQWIVLKKDAARQNNVSDPHIDALPVSNDSVTQQQLLNNFTSNKETYLQTPPEIILDAAHNPSNPQATKDVASENKKPTAKQGKAATLIVPPSTKVPYSSAPLDSNETYPQPAIETTNTAVVTTKETSNKAAKEDKRIIPLSMLIQLKGQPMMDKRQKHLTGMEITLQNNSSEILKSIAVNVLYYKKGEKHLGKEVLYFKNIQPKSSATLKTTIETKAASAQYQLGTIIREDGSLYLVR